MKQKWCLLCGITASGIRKLQQHHIEWTRFGYSIKGETITVCPKHHQSLHAWVTNKAIKMCINNNANFFYDVTREFLEESHLNPMLIDSVIKHVEEYT